MEKNTKGSHQLNMQGLKCRVTSSFMKVAHQELNSFDVSQSNEGTIILATKLSLIVSTDIWNNGVLSLLKNNGLCSRVKPTPTTNMTFTR